MTLTSVRSSLLPGCWIGVLFSAGTVGGQLVSERLWWVYGSSERLRPPLTAFMCSRQDSGACTCPSAVSNSFSRGLQNAGEFRWELGSEGGGVGQTQEGKIWRCSIYSLLKMIQLCPQNVGSFFPPPMKCIFSDNTHSQAEILNHCWFYLHVLPSFDL